MCTTFSPVRVRPITYCLALMISTTSTQSVNPFKPQQPKPIRKAETGKLTSRFQTRPANQKPINILLRRQIPTILLTHAPPINNPRLLRLLLPHLLPQPFPYRGMHFLRLFRGGDFSRSDSPDGFVSDDDFGPAIYFGGDGGELRGYDGDGLVGFALLGGRIGQSGNVWRERQGGMGGGDTYFERFTNTENNPQSTIECGFRLTRDELNTPDTTYQPPHHITLTTCLQRLIPKLLHSSQEQNIPHLILLPQNRPPLTMSRQRPRNPTISQLLRTNLARKRSIPLIEHILRRDFDLGF